MYICRTPYVTYGDILSPLGCLGKGDKFVPRDGRKKRFVSKKRSEIKKIDGKSNFGIRKLNELPPSPPPPPNENYIKQ